jgi:hypothetical protein
MLMEITSDSAAITTSGTLRLRSSISASALEKPALLGPINKKPLSAVHKKTINLFKFLRPAAGNSFLLILKG